ncbi:hypothetical protein CHS0354_033243 [Potamilus streckersoni]|uniref:Regulator of G-protein signaling 7 n=1 Tax=Potamilus streckersoni TaxID=2493646 RepID=A0AAE0S766_9BIVA|nr:hypothetical protein CHS0354_033243 [Potamilus streckersoni]
MTICQVSMDSKKDTEPRHMVFSRMETIISRMQSRNNGIQITKKGTFSGYDLIAWLMYYYCRDNTNEAIHLSRFLLNYGYIFPVDLKNFNIKNEKSATYRFQAPKYWPSNNMKFSNQELVIYLLKRSMRNKQKHALEDFEEAMLNKLLKFLSDETEFLRDQAKEQVKLRKQEKREEKYLHDSQERAFWRVQKPPPGQIRCLDEGPSRYFQPSQMISRKQKNRDLLQKEIQYLKAAIDKPRMKMSKVCECNFQRNSLYMEYDPLIDSNAAQPSNPWTSDNTAMWDINQDDVEIPTEMRVKKWSLSFEDLLSDKIGIVHFEDFLKKEYSQENIRFWKKCRELKYCPKSKLKDVSVRIYSEFLAPGAPCEINIDGKTMALVNENTKEVNPTSRFVYEPAVEHIYALMKNDSYARYLRSDHYKQFLEQASQNHNKKRLFGFTSSTKRQASPQLRRRGSTSSDQFQGQETAEIYEGSFHSYSTGNLRELGNTPRRSPRPPHSPGSVRRRTDEPSKLCPEKLDNSRRRSNLEVPRQSGYASPDSRKSDLPCVMLPVKTNMVAPLEEAKK